MSDQGLINPKALEPLHAPWVEPDAHRIKGERKDEPAGEEIESVGQDQLRLWITGVSRLGSWG